MSNPLLFDLVTYIVSKGICVEDGTDIFTFDILENGSAELVFLTNDPQYEQKEYAYGYGLKVAISDTFINLDNRLWRRKES